MALFRFAILSEVRVLVLRGRTLPEAVREVTAREHLGLDGRPRRVSARSLYRWWAASRGGGLSGLAPALRAPTASRALDNELIAFLAAEKRMDRRASIPELLRRALQEGVIQKIEDVDRTTVWRTLRRLGVATRDGKPQQPDQRRFSKESRLQIVLCDGKYFRAGRRRARRVALFFIDDATRYVPQVVVGPSESSRLFLRGFHKLLELVGRMDLVYFDHGSAFIADDSHEVLGNLDIAFVHGTAGYPPGRGKIEKFNQTAEKDVLRDLIREEVDPDCLSLELRLEHYLREIYNRQPHSSLKNQTPESRFNGDERPLRPYTDGGELRRHFFVREERLVSNDHVISLDSVFYEVPRGLSGQRVRIARDVLEPGHLRLDHQGRSIRLHPVDLHANARARRGETVAPPEPPLPRAGAASRAAEKALGPITQPDGGFPAREPNEEPPWK